MSESISVADAVAHSEITNLLSLYYQALDRGELDVLEKEVMSDDATWEMIQIAESGRIEDKVSGRDNVIAWFKKMLSSEVTMSEGTVRHFIGTHVIHVDGSAARSTSHLHAIDTRTMATLANGFVEAEHVKTGNGWRIRSYRVEESITEADMKAFRDSFGR